MLGAAVGDTSSEGDHLPDGRFSSSEAGMRRIKAMEGGESAGGSDKDLSEESHAASDFDLEPVGKTEAASQDRPSDDSAPPTMHKPENPDDLKLIAGVGSKIESLPNDLGIYKFEQIAGWNETERAWVDEKLRLKGRIERENWIEQAKTLAEK